MRILVHEFASGGGLAGQVVPDSLAREGAAMLRALVADLAAMGSHSIVTTMDRRFPLEVAHGVEVIPLSAHEDNVDDVIDGLIASSDAVWFVAPETGGTLERLAARAERIGTRVLGSGSATIRRVSDKATIGRRLARQGVAYPSTRVLGSCAASAEWEAQARDIGYPVVVKPRRGAGCEGVSLVDEPSALAPAVARAREVGGYAALLLQEFVPGVAVSVSLVADGRRAVALGLNSQDISLSSSFHYSGGTTPFDHPLRERAIDVATGTAGVFAGMRGYIGVDLVLTDTDAVLIEVNARLTTAYLGVRATGIGNIAAMAIAACEGTLPASIPSGQRVCFNSDGEIVSTTSMGQVT